MVRSCAIKCVESADYAPKDGTMFGGWRPGSGKDKIREMLHRFGPQKKPRLADEQPRGEWRRRREATELREEGKRGDDTPIDFHIPLTYPQG